jgi:hypothetical protein
MLPKPIGPDAHCAIDYGFAAFMMLAPDLLGLNRIARSLCYFFGIVSGGTAAMTDSRVGLSRAISLRRHGELETPFLPTLLVLPWLTGQFDRRGTRDFFLGFFVIACLNFFLTDYNAGQTARKARSTAKKIAAQAQRESIGETTGYAS